MKTELQIFTDLARQEKINYMVSFYQGMMRKTNNSEYIAKFQSKIDEVAGYQENDQDNQNLIALYSRILNAKEATKERKMEEMKKHIQEEQQKLAQMEANDNQNDPEEDLAEALTRI